MIYIIIQLRLSIYFCGSLNIMKYNLNLIFFPTFQNENKSKN